MSVAVVRDPPAEAMQILLRAAADPTQRARLHALLGPFCHECRNQLNTLRLSLYLAGRSSTTPLDARWREQDARYRELEETFERLHQICRPLPIAPVRLPVELLWDEAVPHWRERCGRRGITLHTRPPAAPVVGEFDPNHLRRGLDGFVEWRAAAAPAGATVSFSWRTEEHRFRVEWRESAADPSSEEREDDPSDAFALPFLARVLAAHGGTLDIDARTAYRVVLRWPLEIRAHE